MKPIWTIGVLVAATAGAWATRSWWGGPRTWEPLARPGRLSRAHAFLESQCSACHAGGLASGADNCKVCHANDRALLERQPTAFHAGIDRCAECHIEHQGHGADIVRMDHVALAGMGLRTRVAVEHGWLRHGATSARHVARVARALPPSPSGGDSLAQTLDCHACHGSQDTHRGLFGGECGTCHITARWPIEGYRHPGPNSRDCNQCHQAPPSHYMEHFTMVSARVAGQEHATVGQCYLCHETNAWNDIQGVGYYKHH